MLLLMILRRLLAFSVIFITCCEDLRSLGIIMLMSLHGFLNNVWMIGVRVVLITMQPLRAVQMDFCMSMESEITYAFH